MLKLSKTNSFLYPTKFVKLFDFDVINPFDSKMFVFLKPNSRLSKIVTKLSSLFCNLPNARP